MAHVAGLKLEVERLQQKVSELNQDRFLRYCPLSDLAECQRAKQAADEALDQVGQEVKKWAKRSGSMSSSVDMCALVHATSQPPPPAPPKHTLFLVSPPPNRHHTSCFQYYLYTPMAAHHSTRRRISAPSSASQVSALFAFMSTGSRKHLTALAKTQQKTNAAVNTPLAVRTSLHAQHVLTSPAGSDDSYARALAQARCDTQRERADLTGTLEAVTRQVKQLAQEKTGLATRLAASEAKCAELATAGETAKASEAETRVASLEAELAAERETSAQSQAKAAAEAEERLQAAVASAQAAAQVESSQLTAKASEAETRVASLEAELVAERETSAQSQAKAATEAEERLQAAVASAQAAAQVESTIKFSQERCADYVAVQAQASPHAVDPTPAAALQTVSPLARESPHVEVHPKPAAANADIAAAAGPSSRGQKRRASGKPVTCLLSGFKTKNEAEKIRKSLEDMNATVKDGHSFDRSVTHVISPQGAVTWKTIAGAVACRWVVHPGWVAASVTEGALVDESKFGAKKATRIFKGQVFQFVRLFSWCPSSRHVCLRLTVRRRVAGPIVQ
jgi:hypothetical protein